jgi:hypothetical protein
VHWNTYQHADLVSDMKAAGFTDAEIVEHDLPAIHGANRWYAISARKPA